MIHIAVATLCFLSGCRVGGGAITLPVISQQTATPITTVTIASPLTSPHYSNGANLTISGMCMEGDTVHLGGDAVAHHACVGSSYSFTVSASVDGIYSYLIHQTDAYQNASSSLPLVWIRKTSVAPPALISPNITPYFSALDTLTFSGNCETGATITLTGDGVGSAVCAASSFSINLTKLADADYSVGVLQTDPAGNTASVSVQWRKHILAISPLAPSLVVNIPQVFTPGGGSGLYTLSIQTNASGGSLNTATNTYTPGTLAGVTDTLLLTDSLGSTVSTDVYTVAGAADHLELVAGDVQTASVGVTFTTPVSVKVVDAFGNGIPSVSLFFNLSNGDAKLISSPVQVSNASGLATVSLRAGFSSVKNTLEVAPLTGVLPDVAVSGHAKLILSESSSATGSGTFGAIYATGNGPKMVLSVDLNGDGKKDTVTLNTAENKIGVFIARGNGLFATMVRYSTCADPSGFATSDLNGDGFADVVVACGPSDNVSILLGNGNGTFAPAQTFSTAVTAPTPTAVATADFNNDGNADICITSSTLADSKIAVFFGNGDGTFVAPATYTTGVYPTAIDVADFDDDMKPDIVTISTGVNLGDSAANVFINSGTGTFGVGAPYTTGAGPVAVVTGDFTGDSFIDFVVANNTDSSISVFTNDGTGLFLPEKVTPTGNGPTSLVATDFDADGKLDLGVTASTDDAFLVLTGLGTGFFSGSTSYPVGLSPTAAVLVDGNADGKLDVIVVSDGSTTFQFLPTQATGVLGFTNPVGVNIKAVASSDFNGDGKSDVAVLNSDSKTVTILTGAGNGLFTFKATLVTALAPSGIATSDVNLDGFLDLLVTNAGTPKVSLFLGVGDGTFQARTDITTGAGPSGVLVGDFNRDGKPDLAITNATSSTLSILIGVGDGTFLPKVDYGTGLNPTGIVSADFNGDHLQDLAVSASDDSAVSILLGNGDGTFQAKVNYPVASSPSTLIAGYFNGDNKIDIAALSPMTSTISVILGVGDGSFLTNNDYSLSYTPESFVAGDFNGDGKIDFAVTNGVAGNFSILIGNGSGAYNSSTEYYTSNTTVNAITSGDFNGDGKIDFILGDGTNNAVQFWPGN